MSKGIGIIGIALALLAGMKSGSTTKTGYTPLVDTPAAGGDIFKPLPASPPQQYSEPILKWTTPPATSPAAGGLTGLKIVDVPQAPAIVKPATTTPAASTYKPLTTTTFTPTPAAIVNINKTSSWTWRTPGGAVTSRPPTQEETDSGLGCPEVPDIWTYPGQSMQALRYCANPQCPSNQDPAKFDVTINPGEVQPTPAVLTQEKDAAGNIRYFCGVCRTYQ